MLGCALNYKRDVFITVLQFYLFIYVGIFRQCCFLKSFLKCTPSVFPASVRVDFWPVKGWIIWNRLHRDLYVCKSRETTWAFPRTLKMLPYILLTFRCYCISSGTNEKYGANNIYGHRVMGQRSQVTEERCSP